MPYDVTVFDTAPTGHTLRLLQMPDNLTKGLEKISRLKERFGGLFEQVWRWCRGRERERERARMCLSD